MFTLWLLHLINVCLSPPGTKAARKKELRLSFSTVPAKHIVVNEFPVRKEASNSVLCAPEASQCTLLPSQIRRLESWQATLWVDSSTDCKVVSVGTRKVNLKNCYLCQDTTEGNFSH